MVPHVTFLTINNIIFKQNKTNRPTQITSNFPTQGPTITNVNRFQFVHLPSNWSQANEYCKSNFGSTLATIKGDEPNYLAYRLAQDSLAGTTSTSNGVWIGLRDIKSEGAWYWANNESLGYTNWHDDMPYESGKQDCGQLIVNTNSSLDGYQTWYVKTKWDDTQCDRQLDGFVCDYPVTNEPTMIPTAVPTASTLTPTMVPIGRNFVYMYINDDGGDLANQMTWYEANQMCNDVYGTTLPTIASDEGLC